MNSPFGLSKEIFRNAENFIVHRHVISNFTPAEELIRETGRWFFALEGEVDNYADLLRLKIWRLRATVVFSLLPFNCSELGLDEQLKSIVADADYVPFLAERAEQLTRIIRFLVDQNPVNPKERKVFELLGRSGKGGLGVGLVTVLARGPIPGWSNGLYSRIRQAAPDCELISSGKLLRYSTYRQIILPAGGRLCPLSYDLYHGFRTLRLDVVAYSKEGIRPPVRKLLPKATPVSSTSPVEQQSLPGNAVEAESVYMDTWMQRNFWETIRKQVLDQGFRDQSESDRQFLVQARLVILANNNIVYLRDDMKVIEISDLVEKRADPEEYGNHYPRRRVNELEDGDLIVLRTSGSGDYLIDVADSLMKSDGKGGLRITALKWKPILERALKEHGSEKIVRLLKIKGHGLGSHRYIWMWTTDLVIRPQSKSVFHDLMTILDDLGYGSHSDRLIGTADARWEQMREINRYHQMAGQRIRQSLLERLREIIEAGEVITDCYHLTLPEGSAGEMSVFRVVGVDSETIEIPHHQVGVIRNLERHVWPG